MHLVSHFLVLTMIHGWSTYLKENFYHALVPQSFSRWISDIELVTHFICFSISIVLIGELFFQAHIACSIT